MSDKENISSAVARKIRLRQLRCFVMVAQKKSFVLAAECLHLTQPAVSRSVRELEELLGHNLFNRSTRGAELTDRGRLFLLSAEASLLQIAQGTRLVVGNKGITEAVRIGALPNVCSHFLPPIIHEFKVKHPSVDIRLVTGVNADLLDGLRRAETDFVIGRLSTGADMKGLLFQVLYDEPLLFIVRDSHPLLNGKPSVQEVVSYPMLVPTAGTIIRRETMRFLAAYGVTSLSNVIETTSSDFQRAYLTMTDAVAVLPRGVVLADLKQKKLCSLELGMGDMSGPVGLTVNPAARLSDAAEVLLDSIRHSR